MEEMEKEQAITKQKLQDCARKVKDVEKSLEQAQKSGLELEELKKSLENVEKERKKLLEEQKELEKKSKLSPWNVDTISNPGFSKTVVNTAPRRKDDDLTDEEREKQMKEFVAKYEKEMKEFGMLRKYDDSRRYLQEHLHLACEHTANYLVIWCINLEMLEKSSLMEHVAHQCICIQYILELSKQLDVDPRACIGGFFTR